jgi:L-lactate dehydrogenase complex protein LldG
MPVPDQRVAVLARIREALRRPAPKRVHGHVDYDPSKRVAGEQATAVPETEAFRTWLPAVGPTLEEQIELFAKNAAGLKADFRAVASMDEAARQLFALAHENGWKTVATHQHPLAAPLAEKLGLPCLRTEPSYAVADLESRCAAITGCDALVAQTGSVLVSAGSAGGRALSVLPPHHVVVARRSQLVPDLAAALQLARKTYAPNWPSFLSLITGPSRTGDIERILVLGAHGPKKLTIFLVP